MKSECTVSLSAAVLGHRITVSIETSCTFETYSFLHSFVQHEIGTANRTSITGKFSVRINL
jgi:hypothetical protein